MKHSAERGAVLTEATLAIPLLLGLLFGIADLALAFSDRCAFLAAFHDATRKLSISSSPCATQEELETALQTEFNARLHSFLPLSTSTIEAFVDLNNPLDPRLKGTMRAPVSCLFCLFFFDASGSRAEYSAAVSLPLERRGSCP